MHTRTSDSYWGITKLVITFHGKKIDVQKVRALHKPPGTDHSVVADTFKQTAVEQSVIFIPTTESVARNNTPPWQTEQETNLRYFFHRGIFFSPLLILWSTCSTAEIEQTKLIGLSGKYDCRYCAISQFQGREANLWQIYLLGISDNHTATNTAAEIWGSNYYMSYCLTLQKH